MPNFKVKKGKKFFWGPRWNFIGRNTKEFNVKVCFMDDCTYKLTENYDQINKLTGQSYNILPFYDKESKSWKAGHHKNSVRFGWRCIDGEEIEILAYVYIDKVRKHKKMLSIKPGEWVHLNFRETDSYYTFNALAENGDGSIAKFKKNSTKKGFMGLFINRLYPYFGGQIAAPHNMRFELRYFKKFI
jgi:hypothetical protein